MNEEAPQWFSEPALGQPLEFSAVIQFSGEGEGEVTVPEEEVANRIGDSVAEIVRHELERGNSAFLLPEDLGRAQFRIRLTIERISDTPQ